MTQCLANPAENARDGLNSVLSLHFVIQRLCREMWVMSGFRFRQTEDPSPWPCADYMYYVWVWVLGESQELASLSQDPRKEQHMQSMWPVLGAMHDHGCYLPDAVTECEFPLPVGIPLLLNNPFLSQSCKNHLYSSLCSQCTVLTSAHCFKTIQLWSSLCW